MERRAKSGFAIKATGNNLFKGLEKPGFGMRNRTIIDVDSLPDSEEHRKPSRR